jgi:mannose-6-phosphate isomerase-like protein (cupin superfamily)
MPGTVTRAPGWPTPTSTTTLTERARQTPDPTWNCEPVAARSSPEEATVAETAGSAFVYGPGEGRQIDLGGFRMSVRATPDETGGLFSLVEADEPAGFGPPLHVHHDAAEAFYVLEGEYIIFLDGREVLCPAGSFIFIPAGMPHGFRVGTVASRKLNFYTPGAMVGYFDDVTKATRTGHVSPEVLSEIALRHSMEVLGPVPEGYV